MQLLPFPSVLADSEVSLLSHFPFMLRSRSLLAVMKATCVVFHDIAPAAPLASPASAMAMSLSLGGFLIIPPTGLLPSCVAILAGWVVVA